jgi:hypothetical protein
MRLWIWPKVRIRPSYITRIASLFGDLFMLGAQRPFEIDEMNFPPIRDDDKLYPTQSIVIFPPTKPLNALRILSPALHSFAARVN